jgi:hypothetical protein
LKTFGEWLSFYRRQSIDPKRGGPLTQQRVLDLLAEYDLKQMYAPSQLSKWESGERKISWQNRETLIALIYVFAQCQGIKTKEEANNFLDTGGYASLSHQDLKLLPFKGFEPGKEASELTLPNSNSDPQDDAFQNSLKEIVVQLQNQLKNSKGAERRLIEIENQRLQSIANISQTQRKILEFIPKSSPVPAKLIFNQIKAKSEYVGEMTIKEFMLRLHELKYLELINRKKNAEDKWVYWREEPSLKL